MKKSTIAVAALLTALSTAPVMSVAYADEQAAAPATTPASDDQAATPASGDQATTPAAGDQATTPAAGDNKAGDDKKDTGAGE